MTDIFTTFKKSLDELIKPGDSLLLAVSGGLDSVVMAHLCYEFRLNFAIAHCNFNLRGEESIGDEAFVEAFASAMGVPFFKTSFETQQIAELKKTSIQLTARDLRYEWLEIIRLQNNYHWIATAHHLNDSIETILFNLAKGTGIRGLTGIAAKTGRIIRPMLRLSRQEIAAFSEEEDLPYREDSSNLEDKYTRNFIRHQLIPLFLQINPNFVETTWQTLTNLSFTKDLFDFTVDKLRQELMTKQADGWMISKEKLCGLPAKETILFELVRPFGYNSDQVKSMILVLQKEPGAIFTSASHRLLNDRSYFIIQPLEVRETPLPLIREDDSIVRFSGGVITFERLEGSPSSFHRNDQTAYFDAEKLQFPLILRKWKSGDSMQPFGMQGKHQKLQDLFSNYKMTRFEKERQWVMESGGHICWVLGLRIAENFKIDNLTKHYYRVQFFKK